MEDDSLRVVNSFQPLIRGAKEAPANYVPEASVIRRVQALSGITGRKAFRRRMFKSLVKSCGSTTALLVKLDVLNLTGETGTVGVAVKCVDINRNTKGEGRSLGEN